MITVHTCALRPVLGTSRISGSRARSAATASRSAHSRSGHARGIAEPVVWRKHGRKHYLPIDTRQDYTGLCTSNALPPPWRVRLKPRPNCAAASRRRAACLPNASCSHCASRGWFGYIMRLLYWRPPLLTQPWPRAAFLPARLGSRSAARLRRACAAGGCRRSRLAQVECLSWRCGPPSRWQSRRAASAPPSAAGQNPRG